MAGLALLGPSPVREWLDQRVSRAVQAVRARPALAVSTAVVRSRHEAIATGVVATAAMTLLLRWRRDEAGRLMLAAVLGATASYGLKRVLRRPRP